MNIKLLTLSAATSAFLIAASPMVSTSMSTDNGGTKKAIDAYSDGAGVLIINQAGDTKFDNSAMNKLVFKYGDAAKSSNTTLKNQVNILSPGATVIEKADAASKLEVAKVVINPPVNGTGCDDGNPQTVSDIWTSGLCAGNNIENQPCDDTSSQTINDKYHNGVCGGTNVEGVLCDDTNAKTIEDKYHNGVCAGINVEGLSCDDTNTLTFADKYTSGICAGVTNGTSCNDNNALTFADKYTDGVCTGVVNGTQCSDNNVMTINDAYNSGVCVGTLTFNGQTCDDHNVQTINDNYNNGVCAGTNVQGLSCDDGQYLTINDKYTNGVCTGTQYTNSGLRSTQVAEVAFSNSTTAHGLFGAMYCRNFSLSFYAKTSQTIGFSANGHIPSNTEQYLFNPSHGGEVYDGVGVSIGTNGLATYAHSAGYLPIGAQTSTSLGTNWNKITIVYVNSAPKIYINGALYASGPVTPRNNACSPTSYGYGSYSKAVTASVKNILLYDRSLTDAEVQSIP